MGFKSLHLCVGYGMMECIFANQDPENSVSEKVFDMPDIMSDA